MSMHNYIEMYDVSICDHYATYGIILAHVHCTGALRTGFVRKSFPDCFSIAIVFESGNEYYLSAYNSHIKLRRAKAEALAAFVQHSLDIFAFSMLHLVYHRSEV